MPSPPPLSPLVKICGVTRVDDALAAIRAGADWIGLNFHPASPRCLSPETAREIVREIGGRATMVGVFVDRPAADVARLAALVGFEVAQLHGDEPDSDVIALRSAGLRVVRAARLGSLADAEDLMGRLERSRVAGALPEALLIDAAVPGQAGGTGTAIADPVLRSLSIVEGSIRLSGQIGLPLILAGGLNPANVRDRVARLRPWMVDVASGVESAPGLKDRLAVESFVREARAARIGGS